MPSRLSRCRARKPVDCARRAYPSPDRLAAGGGGAKGSLLFLSGRADFYEKYLEARAYWHRGGWRVTAIDWRGQAGSGRPGANPAAGHLAGFTDWIDDLAAFWRSWRADGAGPHVAIGHSMGGHLLLRALAEGRIDPAAAVLVAPMLGFAGPPLPLALLHRVARGMCATGDRCRPAWRGGEKPGLLPLDRAALLTHDADRYADEMYWRAARPELVTGPPSWDWIERALDSMRRLARVDVLARVRAPLLLLSADADRLVDARANIRAARLLPDAWLVRFGAETAHELLREADPVRDRALAEIDRFLAERCADGGSDA